MKPTILVLGGGIGGVTVAKALRNEFGNEDGIDIARILVFEKEKRSLYSPSLTWMMVGKRKEDQISHELSGIEFGGVEIIHGNVESIDPKTKSVVSNGTKYKGDYLVIALGADKTDRNDLEKSGHNFYTPEGAQNFYDDLKHFKGGKFAIVVPSLPHTSPVAPYEAAFLIDDFLNEKGYRDKTEIHIFTPEEKPMPFAGDKISQSVFKLLKEKNIEYHPGLTFSNIEKNVLRFNGPNNGAIVQSFDLLAYTPDHSCPDILKVAGLTGSSGWVEVDSHTLQTPFENIWAIGDIVSIKREGDKTIPKAGVFAQIEAQIVAHNIVRKQAGKLPNHSFEAIGHYFLDQGSKASKVDGNFDSDKLSISKTGMLKHLEKVLAEKTWFLKNFQK